jgi:hypothetical protein
MSNESRAPTYRKKAAELRQIADKFATPDLQQELIDLASKYEELASQADTMRGSGSQSPIGPGTKPLSSDGGKRPRARDDA